MTSKFLTLSFIISCFASLVFAQHPANNVHIGFIYPLSTNGIYAPSYTNAVSLHAIAGVSRKETAFCAAGLANIIKDSADGVVAAGFANTIGSYARGAQLAGFSNYTGGQVSGFAAAGFINVTRSLNGAATAGFANLITKQAHGFLAAGFINVADSVTGAEVAGFGNITAKDTKGPQVAGFINESRNVNTQVGGFINIAADVEGAQVAGFINIAKKVKGAQVAGFINIADSSDCPIGIVNIIKNGEQAIGLTSDETGTMIAAFRSGGRRLYGIIGVGANPSFSAAYALQAGLGAHFPVSRTVRFNVEGSSTWLYDFNGHSDLRSGIRVMPAVRFGPLEVFAGPSFNYSTTADAQGIGKVGYSVWNDRNRRRSHDLSIGLEAGIQFHLNGRH